MYATEVKDKAAWTQLVERLGGHPQQAWQWGELKAKTGPWTVRRIALSEGSEQVGGAQVLVRKMPPPFGCLAYVPRGPFVADPARLSEAADVLADWTAEYVHPVSIKIDPAVTELELSAGWRPSERVLVQKTAVIDLAPSEDELMAGIPNRKARQYIRKAGRDGVVCREGTAQDLPQILEMYKATADADGFALHEDAFYHEAFETLGELQQLFVAEREGTLEAFLWNITTPGGTAFELWGAVTDAGKRSRANYLLKWTGICAAKERGAALYDLNGLLNDGISDFKLLFVKEPTLWVGTFDKPQSPLAIPMNALLELRRKIRGRKSTQQDTSEQR